MKEGFESLGRVKLQGLALLTLAFLVGVLVGFAADRLWRSGERPEPPFAHTPPMMHEGQLPPHYERLDLSEAQRGRILAILRERRPLTDSILRETLPRLRAITDSLRAEIRALLTPEQRERLDELRAERRRRFGPDGPPFRRPGMRPRLRRDSAPPPPDRSGP